MPMTRTPSHSLYKTALSAVAGELPQEPVRRLLEAYLTHADRTVRYNALRGLLEIPTRKSIAHVLVAQRTETDQNNKKLIAKFLARFPKER